MREGKKIERGGVVREFLPEGLWPLAQAQLATSSCYSTARKMDWERERERERRWIGTAWDRRGLQESACGINFADRGMEKWKTHRATHLSFVSLLPPSLLPWFVPCFLPSPGFWRGGVAWCCMMCLLSLLWTYCIGHHSLSDGWRRGGGDTRRGRGHDLTGLHLSILFHLWSALHCTTRGRAACRRSSS